MMTNEPKMAPNAPAPDAANEPGKNAANEQTKSGNDPKPTVVPTPAAAPIETKKI